MKIQELKMHQRFRRFLPVVVDIETAGFNYSQDAVLEIAMVTIKLENGIFSPDVTYAKNILPFEGATINHEALKFNGVHDPFNPLRAAITEDEALAEMLPQIKTIVKQNQCSKAILVGHNAWFDLHFLNAAINRCQQKSPFHSFSSFDTATLGGLVYGHTVLAELMYRAKITWDNNRAHSAIYDAEKTAKLFCKIINNTTMNLS